MPVVGGFKHALVSDGTGLNVDNSPPPRMSAMGQKQTCAAHKLMSALHPIATVKADFPRKVMSALPPKADMCGATNDVRFGPIADIDVSWSVGGAFGLQQELS